MRALERGEQQQTGGGILWSTPALVALADSASLSPLAWSFGVGFLVGTYLYHTAMD